MKRKEKCVIRNLSISTPTKTYLNRYTEPFKKKDKKIDIMSIYVFNIELMTHLVNFYMERQTELLVSQLCFQFFNSD